MAKYFGYKTLLLRGVMWPFGLLLYFEGIITSFNVSKNSHATSFPNIRDNLNSSINIIIIFSTVV